MASAFTILGAIFLAEMTDKDALLLLTLATKAKPWRVFAAGSIAFTATTAIIVLVGSALVRLVPIAWIKLAGGVIMLGYAVYQYVDGLREESSIEKKGEGLATVSARSALAVVLSMIAALIVLDLAGDATELLIVIFVAQYGNLLLVFISAATALVAASAVEVALGRTLGRILSEKRIRYISIVVFLVIGGVIILSATPVFV